MTPNSLASRLLLGTVALAALSAPLPLLAQPVVSDGSTGTVVTPTGANTQLIEGGTQQSSALFHSFERFGILEGHRVDFANPASVSSIFSRVTGRDPSLIFGTLGVLGNADLWLINPNGILFGPNAQLDMNGAFTATTGTGIVFPGGERFDAVNPGEVPLLTVNVQAPVGVVFEGRDQGVITNQGVLEVDGDLSLIGNNLDLQGKLYSGESLTLQAENTVKIRDSSTAPFIAASGGDLLIQGRDEIDVFALSHPDSGLFSFGDLTLRSTADVKGDTHYWSYGNFRIEQMDGTVGNLYSPRDPIIRAAGDVSFNDYIGASLHIFAGGSISADSIIVIEPETSGKGTIREDVVLSDGTTVISIRGDEQPTIDIRAGTTAFHPTGFFESFFGKDFAFASSDPTLSSATSADISIEHLSIFPLSEEKGLIYVTNQYKPNNSLPGGAIRIGSAGVLRVSGDIFIESRDMVTINDPVSLAQDPNSVALFTASNSQYAGEIHVNARNDIDIFGRVFANTLSFLNVDDPSSNAGNGGNITLRSGTNIFIDGSISSNSIEIDALSGNGGNITLLARDSITVDGHISSDSTSFRSSKNAGDIKISSLGEISLGSVSANSLAVEGNAGLGGDIEITSVFGDISLSASSTSHSGEQDSSNGGDINIESTFGAIDIGNINSGSSSNLGNSGNAGNIDIESSFSDISARNIGATSLSSSLSRTSTGNASSGGNISLRSPFGNIRTEKLQSYSRANDGSTGNGGSINLEARNDVEVVAQNSITSQIIDSSSASNGNAGDGGNITIKTTTGDIVVGDDVVSASASGNENANNGGRILLQAELGSISTGILQSSSGAENGSSGNAGDIELTAQSNISSQAIQASSVAEENSGLGGSVTLKSDMGAIEVDGGITSTSTADNGSSGNGGNIELTALDNITSLSIQSISSSSQNSESGGSIILESITGDIGIDGNILSASISEQADSKNGGSINLHATTGTITTQNIQSLSGSPNGIGGDGGRIELLAQDDIITGDLDSRAFTVSLISNSGDVSLTSTLGTITTGNIDASGFFGFPGVINSGVRGNVTLDSYQTLDISNISIYASGSSPGGDITLSSEIGNVNISDSLFRTSGFGNSSGGNIAIEGQAIAVQNTNFLSNSSGTGSGGTISLSTPGNISLANSRITTALEPGASGQAGDVIVEGDSLSARDVTIDSATFGQGDAGDVLVDVDNVASFYRSSLFSITNGEGDSGQVTIRSGGALRFDQSSNVSTAVGSDGIGNGGDVLLEGASLSLLNGSQVQALTQGTADTGLDLGNAGNVSVNIAGDIVIAGTSSDGFASGVLTAADSALSGRGGTINVQGDSLLVTNGAALNSQTASEQDAGNIDVRANNVTLTNGGQLISSTTGKGAAGDITVIASESVTLSGVFNRTLPTPVNQITPSLRNSNTFFLEREPNNSLSDAQSLDSIWGINDPNDANPFVEFSERNPYVSIIGQGSPSPTVDYYSISVDVAGTRIVTDVDEINLTTPTGTSQYVDTVVKIFDQQGDLVASNDNALASLGKFGSNSLGDDNVSGDPYLSYVAPSSGTYFIEVSQAGADPGIQDQQVYLLNVSLDVPKVVPGVLDTQTASGLFSRTTDAGEAGSITVVTDRMLVDNNAEISVSSTGSAASAGDIDLKSHTLYLDNQGRIAAETFSGDGGNVRIRDVSLLMLRRGNGVGGIFTNAGTANAGGNGGNIFIDADFIFAVPQENTDISANAFEGNGGKVRIITTFMRGLTFRPQLTPFSDITVSSVFGVSGTFSLESPGFDPVATLNALPAEPGGPQTIQSCQANNETASLVDEGRGGLPPRPEDPLTAPHIFAPWLSLDLANGEDSNTDGAIQPVETEPQLVAACGTDEH